MDYALIKNGKVADVIVADAEFIAGIANEWDHIEPLDTSYEQQLGVGIGWGWDGAFVPPAQPTVAPPETPIWEWYIDIGSLFDRFGQAKMAVLTSQDAGVQAIIKDLQVRKWVDLRHSEVAASLAYIGSKVSEVTDTMQTEILTKNVSDAENMALRVLYFKG